MPTPTKFPEHIGRYAIIRSLGQGGMGRVALAIDPVLGRQVAIKVLRDDLGIPPETRKTLLDRMRHEAQAAGALSHPNMVTIHDMGDANELGLYLVFEYVEGPTLRERLLTTGEVSPSEGAKIAREMGNALTHAHEAGVIHRDVKPENVLLSKTGSMITDFGIARLPDSTLTTAGAILGTPAYSAPEALSEGRFGPRSDQFSFAVTMYEALSGRRAYPGDDAIAVAGRIATDPPPRISSIMAPSRMWVGVDKVISRALSKNPAHRYASCSEFGDALAKALDGVRSTPPESVPMSLLPRETKRVHNYAAVAALLVILVLLLVDPSSPSSSGVSLRQVARSYFTFTTPTPPKPKPPARPTTPAPLPKDGANSPGSDDDGGAEPDESVTPL